MYYEARLLLGSGGILAIKTDRGKEKDTDRDPAFKELKTNGRDKY